MRALEAARCDAMILYFGAYKLLPTPALLGNRPVNLGPVGLRLLMALATRPGEIVTQRELISLVSAPGSPPPRCVSRYVGCALH
jgi:DNA-binding response OmpR family regulator